jgi:ketosteroid isomerase-like protein
VRLQKIAAFLAITFVPALTAAAPSAPPAPILQLANTLIHGTNTDDASAFSDLFTEDAMVVDENAPFVWRGAGAGVAWWHVVEEVIRKAKIAHLKASNIRIAEFKRSSTDAYMVQAMTITGTTGSKPFAEPGTLTYTFHNAGGKWLISSLVWTAKP